MFGAARHWLGKNEIAFMIEENKNIIVSIDGWYDESTSLIITIFNCNGLTIDVSVMSAKN